MLREWVRSNIDGPLHRQWPAKSLKAGAEVVLSTAEAVWYVPLGIVVGIYGPAELGLPIGLLDVTVRVPSPQAGAILAGLLGTYAVYSIEARCTLLD